MCWCVWLRLWLWSPSLDLIDQLIVFCGSSRTFERPCGTISTVVNTFLALRHPPPSRTLYTPRSPSPSHSASSPAYQSKSPIRLRFQLLSSVQRERFECLTYSFPMWVRAALHLPRSKRSCHVLFGWSLWVPFLAVDFPSSQYFGFVSALAPVPTPRSIWLSSRLLERLASHTRLLLLPAASYSLLYFSPPFSFCLHRTVKPCYRFCSRYFSWLSWHTIPYSTLNHTCSCLSTVLPVSCTCFSLVLTFHLFFILLCSSHLRQAGQLPIWSYPLCFCFVCSTTLTLFLLSSTLFLWVV